MIDPIAQNNTLTRVREIEEHLELAALDTCGPSERDERLDSALEAARQQGSSKRFVTLTLDAPGDCDAPYMSCIWHDGKIVGETLSGGWGYRVDASVALGMVPPALTAEGTKVEIEIYGERYAATVRGEGSLWDPENARIRA